MPRDVQYTPIVDPERLWLLPASIIDLANELAPRIFRKDVSQPGFALIDLGPTFDPAQFRSMLIGFYSALDGIYLRDFSRRLLLQSVGRFDQKVTTEPHLDGAPDESILMLGYEPSPIASRLFLMDYTRCAADQNLTPAEFLDRYHLNSSATRAMLQDYATEAEPFAAGHYRIAIINNSRLPIAAGASGMLGVLHQSQVSKPQVAQTRMISTMLMSPGEAWADDPISAEALRAYVESGAFNTGRGM